MQHLGPESHKNAIVVNLIPVFGPVRPSAGGGAWRRATPAGIRRRRSGSDEARRRAGGAGAQVGASAGQRDAAGVHAPGVRAGPSGQDEDALDERPYRDARDDEDADDDDEQDVAHDRPHQLANRLIDVTVMLFKYCPFDVDGFALITASSNALRFYSSFSFPKDTFPTGV